METLQRTANRGSISTGFDIDYSLKNESDNGERFQSPNLGTPTSVRTFTFSMWVKRTELAANGSQPYILNFQANTGISVYLQFAADSSTDSIYYLFQNSSVQAYGKTKAVFRDTSAWMHIVWRVDTTQSTATDRVRIYVNGVDQEIESGGGGHPAHPDQNYDVPLQTTQYVLGYDGGNNGFCGYAADYLYSDGQSLAPTEFGETDSDTGIWIPKDVSGTTFGNAGYYLDFADSSALGKDVGNSKGNFSHYGGSAADQATDTPTNNFAIINTLQSNSSKLIISNGATDIVKSGNHGWQTTTATMAVTLGKWYAEFKLDTSCDLVMLGVNQIEDEVAWNGSHIGAYSNSTAQGMGYYSSNGHFYRNGGSGAIGSSYLAGDIISIALRINADGTGFMGMAKNGTWQNSQDPSSGTSGMLGLNYGSALPDDLSFTFAISTHQDAGGVLANFGGFDGFTVSSGNSDANGYGNFEYAVPTGYYALCTKNLAEYG